MSLVALALLGAVCASSASAAECANEAIRVQQHATRMPECRAWEMVSPSNKESGEVFFTLDMGGTALTAVTTPSLNGEQLIYSSFQAWGENPSGIANSYIATRTGAGWQSQDVSPAPTFVHPNVAGHALIDDITPEFSHAISSFNFSLNPLDQNNPEEQPFDGADLYMREANGSWTWLSRGNEEVAATTPTTESEFPIYAGRSADASHVLFETTQKLVPADAGQEAGEALYDRVEGRTELVNVNSAGTLLNTCGAIIGGLAESDQAVSEDGSHIYFTAPDPQAGGPASCAQPAQVYLRYGGRTVEVSESQRGVPDPKGSLPASFQGASADGQKVFFTSAQALTDSAEPLASTATPFLYEYDVATGQLHLLTPNLEGGGSPNVKRVVAVAKDGAQVYFAAEPTVGGKPKPMLEMYESGQVREIGEVTSTEMYEISEKGQAELQVRLSADGHHLAFADKAQLTGFANHGFAEIYLYDAGSGSVQCISCNSDGHVPLGDASLSEDAGGISTLSYPLSVNLTANGGKVFFETPDDLLPEDKNRSMDVYEWDEGGLHLISGGQGETPSFLIGSAVEGRDVFFTTTDSLVSQDTDNGDNDVYDARVGGGFAAPAQPQVCVSGCQEGMGSAPSLSTPGSALIGTDGNLRPSSKRTKARKHKARKHKKQKRSRKKAGSRARHGGRKKHQHRAATRARRNRARGATSHRDTAVSGR
jgi:catechol 2,3-dioxygenase-like lactoylglutathione lyase family enzyme